MYLYSLIYGLRDKNMYQMFIGLLGCAKYKLLHEKSFITTEKNMYQMYRSLMKSDKNMYQMFIGLLGCANYYMKSQS